MDSVRSERVSSTPAFTGKKEDFTVWWTRFGAYANLLGFAPALQEGGEDDLPTIENEITGSDEEKAMKNAAVKRNTMAVYKLAMTFQTGRLIRFINRTQTDDWPTGKAHDIMRLLKTSINYPGGDEEEAKRGLASVAAPPLS